MTEQYEPVADRSNDHHENGSQEHEGEESKLTQKMKEQVRELLAEKVFIDENRLPNAVRLIDQEISKLQQTGRPIGREYKYVDIYREKPIKVTVKVLVPIREHPKFNFVGKLLGPKGNSMKRLQEETMCRMAILGKGSMKDRNREEELRKSFDPKYAHLYDDLHVEISAFGPPAESYARIAFALAEVRKYLVPDSNDHIRQEQMKELEILGDRPSFERSYEKKSILKTLPRPGPPPMRTATRVPVSSPVMRPVMPAKTKILSILDKARTAMKESYDYEDEVYEPRSTYDGYLSSPSYSKKLSPYYSCDYDQDYYKESSSYVYTRGSENLSISAHNSTFLQRVIIMKYCLLIFRV
ncbi:KH domain-containing, RNA-binding, signal transduction-associated protein 2 isoform X2 [Cylas formicarius]|uniref:KH domain-containing, RNA-binding, signal transduction-associated protein 2 isoform X2 n=1 Tax=Cylas formicarius TaxID=197179 RepID=UPI002958B30E|nr:KH domain-containing, RNA-binding, signal transduction-associated protein 2 isoform X2 [Cylas formicarius]